MKTYEETARDVLARRDEYNSEKKKSRKRFLTAVVPTLAVALVIGVGIFAWSRNEPTVQDDVPHLQGDEVSDTEKSESGDDTLNKEISVKPSDNKEKEDASDVENGDKIGWLKIDGVLYVQCGAGDAVNLVGNNFFLGGYLGKAHELSGYYKEHYEKDGITGDVYMVNWKSADIVIMLSNGGVVSLKSQELEK
ncbi:MAG: hypothetical protein IJS45_04615 [Clostridia bacterium]|nr:hypothetical protein [Clostridia bacterium]